MHWQAQPPRGDLADIVDHLAALLLGIGNGGVFAALALALVVTYRSSGVLNFATGAVALYGAYTYAFLRDGLLLNTIPGIPTTIDFGSPLGVAPAMAIALVISGILGAALYLAVFRPMRNAPPLARAVASLGVLVVIQGSLSIRLGSKPVSVAAIFPDERWEWGSLTVLSDRFYLAVTIMVLTLFITAVFRWTRFGLHTRATAESQTGAHVSGISPDRVALLNWIISATVAGAAGILIAPLTPLVPVTYTLFVVPALAAAVVGGFQNLVPTAVAGLAIGMLQSEAILLAGEHSWLPQSGSFELIPLVVILVALLVSSGAVPVRGTLLRQPLGRAPRPRALALPMVGGLLIGAVALFVTHGSARDAVIVTFILGIIMLSLVVVTGFAGQVSMAQLALAGAGAFTLSFLTESWNVPFPIAPVLAGLAATVLGVVVGLPALRLRGLTLGVVTLALAYAIEAVWFRNTQIVDSFGARISPARLFGVDLSVGTGKEFPRIQFGLVCLIAVAVVAGAVAKLRMSSLGSAMLAVRSNERSAAGIGLNVVYVKVVSFAIASFIAGLGGSLLAYYRTITTWDSFSALGGLTLLSTAYLAGVTSVWGALLAGIIGAGGIIFFIMDHRFGGADWFPVISGALLVLTLIIHPEGIASTATNMGERLHKLLRRSEPAEPAGATEPVSPVAPVTRTAPPDDAPRILEVAGLTVRYSGVVAVSDVSLFVPAGGIIGLIGPNGAGKTSAIDAITGFAGAEGEVRFDGEPVDSLPPHLRVRRGLARTFQSLELYDDLTVEENLSAAAFAVKGAARRSAVQSALDLVGIGGLGERDAGELSQGERQLVSVARACAAKPKVLLLDEPAAGLDTTESKRLADRIRGISSMGTGVLLVDHDVALVLEVCDYVYVLDFGKVIAEGTPAAIRSNRKVADAYLGNVHGAATAVS